MPLATATDERCFSPLEQPGLTSRLLYFYFLFYSVSKEQADIYAAGTLNDLKNHTLAQ
jgi:hypothetical protein